MALNDRQLRIRGLLYNHGPIQRFTQDSPVLPDVWMEFAKAPEASLDLLLTPYQASQPPMLMPGDLSRVLNDRLGITAARTTSLSPEAVSSQSRQLAYNESVVATKLTFDELIRGVIPLTDWWISYVVRRGLSDKLKNLSSPQYADELFKLLTQPTMRSPSPSSLARPESSAPFEIGPDVLWFIRVVGAIVLMRDATKRGNPNDAIFPEGGSPEEQSAYYLRLIPAVAQLFQGLIDFAGAQPLVYVVNINREASVTMWRSCLAIKADAARQLFNLKCEHLAWAVVDSGIDARHPSFRRRDGHQPQTLPPKWQDCSRVVRTYDFTMIRDLLSNEPTVVKRLPQHVSRLLRDSPNLRPRLTHTIDRIQRGLDIDWGLVLPLIEIPHTKAMYRAPNFEHGTHVAGIIGSNWQPGEENPDLKHAVVGVCPDIQLYDFRVLNDEGRGDEFNVIAALQAVRYINSQKSLKTIHGVNISLAIPHQVWNYACGRTPICEECDRLWQSGVTVVAAAGNRGYNRDEQDSAQAYRTISITDPGNGERLITVGATHRDMPHTYGVSFFSSRGPTGDGRAKPDIVAPGEKIQSCVPGAGLRRLDGTSMAAPHVSGAAALLMARHSELVGEPDRIKDILCKTATDLGREHYFQGHGMLDVLRALQSV